VLVDRLGFRTTSVVADLASAGAVAAIPLLHSTIGIELWQLMALVFVGALLDAPGATARLAMLPDLVELAGVGMERANGIRSAIQQGAYLVGAPIGGLLVAGIGATTTLWLDAASFLVSAALIARFVPRPKTTAGDRAPRPLPCRARGRTALHLELDALSCHHGHRLDHELPRCAVCGGDAGVRP
jgi:MFS family permease